MGFHLRDLPVYIMLGAVIGFIVYVIIQSWKPEEKKEDRETEKK